MKSYLKTLHVSRTAMQEGPASETMFACCCCGEGEGRGFGGGVSSLLRLRKSAALTLAHSLAHAQVVRSYVLLRCQCTAVSITPRQSEREAKLSQRIWRTLPALLLDRNACLSVILVNRPLLLASGYGASLRRSALDSHGRSLFHG